MKKEIEILSNSVSENIDNNFNSDLKINFSPILTEKENEEKLENVNLFFSETLEKRKYVNSVEGLEGELLISKVKNNIVEIDINGELIFNLENSNNYRINDYGELIFER